MISDPASAGWALEPQLARDAVTVGDLPLSRVLLMNDANYPWLLLVPRRRNISEITDLSEADQTQLMREVAQAANALKALTRCDKINLAAIGNVVPQLHVHVIARFRSDAAWPKPVWGFAPARAYKEGAREQLITALRSRVSLS